MIKELIIQKLNEGLDIPSPDLRTNWHHFTTNPSIGANYAGRNASYRKQSPFVMAGSLNMSKIKVVSGLDIQSAADRDDHYQRAYDEKDMFGRPRWHGIMVTNVQDLPINPKHSPHTETTTNWGDVGVLFTDRLPKGHYIPGQLQPSKGHQTIYHGTTVEDGQPRSRLG